MSNRLLREKKFHDERFADGVGARKQDKFYTAVKDARSLLDCAIACCTNGGGLGLEIGCSTGENLERLLGSATFKAYGIDISDAAVAAASARLFNCEPRPELAVMDANALTYPDSTFDFCFGSGVLHHLTLPDSIYEIRRVLKTGGRCLFLEPLATNPLIQLYRKMTPRDRSDDETPLTAKHLKHMCVAFPNAKLDFFGFFTIPCVLLNKFPRVQRRVLAVASALDKALFALPGAWRFAWVVVIRGIRA